MFFGVRLKLNLMQHWLPFAALCLQQFKEFFCCHIAVQVAVPAPIERVALHCTTPAKTSGQARCSLVDCQSLIKL
jgi:hypothetical protein